MGTSFLQLAKVCNQLEQTSKINEKIDLLASFLSSLEEGEINDAVLLIIGNIFAESDPKTLSIDWKSLVQTKANIKQQILFEEPLTITKVQLYFNKLAKSYGTGSQKRKRLLLQGLFRNTSPIEQKFLMRAIMGEMRHGVGEGIMLKAIAKASKLDLALIKKKSAIYGNIGEIAKIAIINDSSILNQIDLHPFFPIKPMLADSVDSIDELLERNYTAIAAEYKYDGIRAQLHVKNNEVRIYSRQLKEMTDYFPEIVQTAQKNLSGNAVILDGEIVAISSDFRPLPFQTLMRRFRRLHPAKPTKQQISIEFYLFDVLYLDGEVLIDAPYNDRRNYISEITTGFPLATRLVSNEKEAIKLFYQTALSEGHEGIIIKTLEDAYYPNERKHFWVKIKDATHIDLVILAADWGSGRRRGWLSNYHLAAYEPQTGTYHVLGKTFKGLTDTEFQIMTAKLNKIKTQETDSTVFVRPKVVVEVAFNEIQQSPTYPSGYALRFARIKRIREDKSPTEIATLSDIAALYEQQFKKKAKF